MSRPGRALGSFRALRAGLAILLLVGLVAAPSSADATKTIALSSGSFAFEVAPGESGEGEVVVMNDGDEPLKALVYITDVKIDDTGQQTFEQPQRQGASILTTPASWFRIFMPADSKSVGNTPYLEMEPGERVPIRFEFSPPQGTPSGDHNVVIFFEMFELAQGSEGAAAQVSGRLGTRIALRVTGEVIERLTIRPFEVPSLRIGNSVPFTFTLNNGGNTNKRVAVTAELLDSSERTVVASVVASDTAIYADSRYRFEGALNTGAGRLGPHTLEIRVQYFLEGASSPTELVESRTVWLVPMWLVLVVMFVIFDLLAYGAYRAWRSRGRKREPAAAVPTDMTPSPASPEPVSPEATEPGGSGAASVRNATGATGGLLDAPPLPSRSARHGRKLTRKELKAEAEERRRRREARAAEEYRRGGGLSERGSTGNGPTSADELTD